MNDFRAEAAAATIASLKEIDAAGLATWGESGCVAVPGGQRGLHLLAWPHLFISILCLGSIVAAWPLYWLDVIDQMTVYLVLCPGFALSLLLPSARAILLRLILSRRPKGFLKGFPALRPVAVGVEDARTYRKRKMVIEDQGVCLLDPERRRVLLEGCAYRYVMCAKDVMAISPVSGYALSGARIRCRMSGQTLDVVLTAAGTGPLASFIGAFDPSLAAKDLASTLNQTLFGAATPAYEQRELPPPVPE
jgi:hypothetical protein